jgi:hypothetical protein
MTRRAFALAVLALLCALLIAGSVRAHPNPRAHPAASSHLQVIELEYRLVLSRGVVKAGAVNLEAIDRGMDPHDLRIGAPGSSREIAVPELTPRRRWNGVIRLRPGSYRLWCSLPEHAKLGMRATLRVVR